MNIMNIMNIITPMLNYHTINTYASGDPLPYFRGTLHLYGSILIPSIMIIIGSITNIDKSWPIMVFLGGKFLSYGSSAVVHLGITRSPDTHLKLLFIDKLCVYISTFVTGVPFMRMDLFYYEFNGGVIISGAILLLCNYEITRKIVFFIQFVGVLYLIGRVVQWNILWIIGASLYISSMIVFLPCAIKSTNNCMVEVCLPVCWHKKGYYGCHEDFHFFVFLADIVFFINADLYLS